MPMKLMNFDAGIIVAGPADAARLAAIARDTFYETWRPVNTEEDMQQYMEKAFAVDLLKIELSQPVNTFFLAYLDKEVIGYAKLRRDRTPAEFGNAPALEIERIYVQGRYHGSHVGAALMNRILTLAREEKQEWIWLGVNMENHKAIRFYERYGFEVFGKKQFRLGNAVDDDYLMKLKLKQEVGSRK
jgi:ribosomal protein S18 acetylase RimI-like enzyme